MRFSLDFLRPKNFPLSVDQCTTVAVALLTVFLLYTLLVGFSLPLYMLAVAASAGFIFYYPEVGLLVATVGIMWFERWFTLEPLVLGGAAYKFYLLDVFLVIIGLSIVWNYYIGRLPLPKWRTALQSFDWPIIFFGILATGGLFLGLHNRHGFDIAFGAYKNYFLYVIVYIYSIILMDSRLAWERFLRWVIIGGVGLFVFFVYGLAAGHGLWAEYAPLSSSGTRLIAYPHAFYFCILAIVLLGQFLFKEGAGKLKKFPHELMLFGAALAVAASLLRHLWLAMAVLCASWLVILVRKERQKLVALYVRAGIFFSILALLAVWVFMLVQGGLPKPVTSVINVVRERASIARIVAGQDSSASWRFAAWRASLGLFAQSPIFGQGLGVTIFGYADNYPFTVPARELHNNYLGILVQLGFVGLLLVAWWWHRLLSGLFSLHPFMRGKGDAWQGRFVFTFGSMVVLFMMVFSIAVYWDVNFFMWWWWLALAAVRYALKPPNL